MSELYKKAKMVVIEKALGICTLSEEALLHRLEEIYWLGCKDGLGVNLIDTTLYRRVNELMAILGYEGEVNTETPQVLEVMDTLRAIDDGVYLDEKQLQKQIEKLNEEIVRLKAQPPASAVPIWKEFPAEKPDKNGWYCVHISDPYDVGWSTDIFWRAHWDGDEFSDCDPISDGQPVIAWLDPMLAAHPIPDSEKALDELTAQAQEMGLYDQSAEIGKAQR